jgi:hypothetical protein
MKSGIAGACAAACILSALPATAAPLDTAAAVPEPEVVALVAIGAVAILIRQIRKLRRVRTARMH